MATEETDPIIPGMVVTSKKIRKKQYSTTYKESRRMQRILVAAHNEEWKKPTTGVIVPSHSDFIEHGEDTEELRKRLAACIASISLFGSSEVRHVKKYGKSSPRIHFFPSSEHRFRLISYGFGPLGILPSGSQGIPRLIMSNEFMSLMFELEMERDTKENTRRLNASNDVFGLNCRTLASKVDEMFRWEKAESKLTRNLCQKTYEDIITNNEKELPFFDSSAYTGILVPENSTTVGCVYACLLSGAEFVKFGWTERTAAARIAEFRIASPGRLQAMNAWYNAPMELETHMKRWMRAHPSYVASSMRGTEVFPAKIYMECCLDFAQRLQKADGKFNGLPLGDLRIEAR